jgi:flagellar biogenesis protein FliO
MRLITATRGVALGSALALSYAQIADADQGESTPLHLGGSGLHAASSTGGASIVRTIIALVLVVGVIYAIARILRAVKGRGQRASGSGLVALATLPLGSGRSLALVRSGRDIVLVGIAENSVNVIKTYSEAEALANGIEVPPELRPDFDQAERPMDKMLDQLRKLTVRS